MKGLTIKEIAPYLPYGLKSYDEEYKEIFQVCSFRQDSEEWLIQDNIDGSVVEYSRDILKPILRPLSDLTKEIEHNGEKFVPMDRLNDYDNGGVAFEYDGNCSMALFYADGFDSFIFSDFENIREKLLECHFDVFGLIEQGLAIDINTI